MKKKILYTLLFMMTFGISFNNISDYTIKAENSSNESDENNKNDSEKTEEEKQKEKEEEERKKNEERLEKEHEERILKEEISTANQLRNLIETYEKKPGYADAIKQARIALDSYNSRTGHYDYDLLVRALNGFKFNGGEVSGVKLFTGDEFGNFNPEKPITRAEFAVMIQRLATGESAFIGASWYEAAMLFCQKSGYLTGDEFGNMMPEKEMTIAEAVTILMRFKSYTALPGDSLSLKNHWARGFMERAYVDGFLKAIKNPNEADRKITRAELASILTYVRGMKIDVSEINNNISNFKGFNDVPKSHEYFYHILLQSN